MLESAVYEIGHWGVGGGGGDYWSVVAVAIVAKAHNGLVGLGGRKWKNGNQRNGKLQSPPRIGWGMNHIIKTRRNWEFCN
jgi:hypothetical protein